MRPQLILHVGTTKTGTTSIQNALSSASPSVIWIYPRAGRAQKAHHNLAYEMREAFRAAGRYKPAVGGWDQALAESSASGAEHVIISSEALSFLNESEVEALAQKLRGWDVMVVLYLRRPDLWLHSRFVQDAKFGRTNLDADAYIDGREAPMHLIDDASHTVIFNNWRAAFGAERLRVFPFQRGVIGPDVVAHFARTCGLTVAYGEPLRANERPPLKGLVAATLARQTCERALQRPYELSVQSAVKLSAFFRPRADFVSDWMLFSVDRARQIISDCADATERLYQMAGPDFPRFDALDARDYAAYCEHPMRLIEQFTEEEMNFVARLSDTIVRAARAA